MNSQLVLHKRIVYYQKAIDSGHLQAMSEYGTILMTGKFGFAKDEQKAKVLLNRSVSNGSFVAKSSMLSTTDPQLFNYVAQIPDLLQKAKRYDTDAMLTLILIYKALNETVLAEQMRVVAMYYLNSEDISKKEQLDHTLLRLAGVSGRDELITSRKEFQKTVYPNGRRSYTMNYNQDTQRTRNNYIEYLLEDFGFSEYLGANDTERNAKFFANLSVLKRFIDGIEKEEVIPLTFGPKEIIYREKRFTFYFLLRNFPNLEYQEAIINLEKINQKKQLTKKEKNYKDYYSKQLKKLNKEQGIQKDSWLLRLKSDGFFKMK